MPKVNQCRSFDFRKRQKCVCGKKAKCIHLKSTCATPRKKETICGFWINCFHILSHFFWVASKRNYLMCCHTCVLLAFNYQSVIIWNNDGKININIAAIYLKYHLYTFNSNKRHIIVHRFIIFITSSLSVTVTHINWFSEACLPQKKKKKKSFTLARVRSSTFSAVTRRH